MLMVDQDMQFKNQERLVVEPVGLPLSVWYRPVVVLLQLISLVDLVQAEVEG